MTTGWAFYKKGVQGHHGKFHYLKDWRSLCGHYNVRIEEEKHMHFTEKSNLREAKICKKCVALLN